MVMTPKKPSSGSGGGARRLRREGFLVLGMHRSGTSSIAGTLVKLGVTAPKTLLQGRSDNPRGHWESEAIMAFHDELLRSAGSRWDDWRPFPKDWYASPVAEEFRTRAKVLLQEEFGDAQAFVLKDPRICRFPRFWLDIFTEERIEPKILVPLRSPLEVAQSHRTRDRFPIRKGLLLWLRHVLDAEAESRDIPRSLFDWSAFLKDWRTLVVRIGEDLNVRWPALTDFSVIEVEGFLSRDLKHQHVSEDDLDHHPELHTWVLKAYEAIHSLARNPRSAEARSALDRIRVRFDEASVLFGEAIADVELGLVEAEQILTSERQQWEAERATIEQALAAEQFMRSEERERLSLLEAKLAQVERDKAALQQAAETETTRLVQKIDELEQEKIICQQQIDAFIRSTSWRLTRPLRYVKQKGKGIHTASAEYLSNVAADSKQLVSGLRSQLVRKYHTARRLVGQVRSRGLKDTALASRHVLATEGLSGLVARARQLASAGEQSSPPGPQEVLDERMMFLARPDLLRDPISLPRSPFVLIVTETTLPQCIKYRVDQKVSTLRQLGIRARGVSMGDVYFIASALQFCTAVIFYRCMLNDLLIAWLEEARRLRIPIGFDADDPFFDRAALAQNANLTQLESYFLYNQMRDAERFLNAMRHADFFTVSTPGMADLVTRSMGSKSLQRPIYIWRNLADEDALDAGTVLECEVRSASRFPRLGYFSGSLAHEADFAVAFPAIETLLSKYDDMEMLIGGHCELGRSLSRFGSRVVFAPFEGYDTYLRSVRECDLILVPLVNNVANRTKSTVRYIDAATQARPVLASPVGDYVNIITDGVDGFFSANDAWLPTIERLIQNPALLAEVGRRAKENIQARFNIASYGKSLHPELIASLTGGLMELDRS